MYPQGNYRINSSGIGCWLTLIAIALLLGSVGLGWIVKSLAVIFVLITITPFVLFFGVRWWLSRNLIEGNCPVCDTALTGLNKTQTVCPNCRTQLQVTREGFERFVPDGTVEVNAVDVTEGDRADEAVNVTVEVLPPADDSL